MISHGSSDIAFHPPEEGTCITVGTFDGVHSGHAEILRFLSSVAQSSNHKSLVFTFDAHPRHVLNHDANELKLLSTYEEKSALIEAYGIDFLYEQAFTSEFANLSAREFVTEILIRKLNMKSLVVGHDHLFGKDRSGDYQLLTQLSHEFHFSLHQIPAVSNAGFNVSSTKIRQLLADADMLLANEMLGYPYGFSGRVAEGYGIGRELGFPTANLVLHDKRKLLPAPGVYIIKALLADETYEGLINIGYRPSFNDHRFQVEAHLFDFDRIIYGENMRISLLLHLRPEIKFDNRNDLVQQIRKDRDRALQYFGRVC